MLHLEQVVHRRASDAHHEGGSAAEQGSSDSETSDAEEKRKLSGTCMYASPGKKLVTHLDLSTEKTPPDADVTKCHKIKYRNVRRFWSLHTKKIELYLQCEKKPGDVWNTRYVHRHPKLCS